MKITIGSQPGPIRRAIGNAGWLLGGKGVSGLFSLIYLALAARSLGVQNFGVFAMILSYGQAIANIVQFQSWQTVIRYGTQHLHQNRVPELKRVIAFTIMLDLGASTVGAICAGLGAFLAGPHLGWSGQQQHIAALFGISLIFGVRGTPTGLLRLFDRFDLAAYSETVLPTMRLLGASTVWMTNATVANFLIAWAVAELVTTIAMWAVALQELRQRVPRSSGNRVCGVTRENAGIWRFAWTTNLTASINLVWLQLPVLLVGWISGAGAAGGYRIASQLTSALGKPTASLARAIYPEFAKLALDSRQGLKEAVRNATKLAACAGVGIVVIVTLLGEFALRLIGGDAYAFAYPPLVVLSIAAAIDLCSFGLEPAMVAIGRPGIVLALRTLVGTAYVTAMILMLRAFGPIGAALAAIGASLLMLLLLSWLSRTAMRES